MSLGAAHAVASWNAPGVKEEGVSPLHATSRPQRKSPTETMGRLGRADACEPQLSNGHKRFHIPYRALSVLDTLFSPRTTYHFHIAPRMQRRPRRPTRLLLSSVPSLHRHSPIVKRLLPEKGPLDAKLKGVLSPIDVNPEVRTGRRGPFLNDLNV